MWVFLYFFCLIDEEETQFVISNSFWINITISFSLWLRVVAHINGGKKKVIRNIIYKLLTIDHILSKCISYFFLGLALIFFFFEKILIILNVNLISKKL